MRAASGDSGGPAFERRLNGSQWRPWALPPTGDRAETEWERMERGRGRERRLVSARPETLCTTVDSSPASGDQSHRRANPARADWPTFSGRSPVPRLAYGSVQGPQGLHTCGQICISFHLTSTRGPGFKPGFVQSTVKEKSKNLQVVIRNSLCIRMLI